MDTDFSQRVAQKKQITKNAIEKKTNDKMPLVSEAVYRFQLDFLVTKLVSP